MVGKVAFLLGTPNNTTSAIFVRVPYGVPQRIGTKLKYNYLKYSIGESVNPAYWNKNNFRAKETLKFPEHSEFNTRLNNIESMIRATLLFFKNQDIVPTKEELKAELDNRIKPTEVVPEVVIPGVKTIEVKDMNLVQFTDYLIKNLALRKTTLTSYEVVKKNLIGFEKKNKKVLTFKNVDIDFYNSFVKFLTNLGLSQNTIGTRIKILKTIIRNADERNIDVSKDYLKKSFSKPHEETEKVYLNEKELNAIYRLNDLPKYLDSVRDTFLIGCYTGLRYSDLSRLTKDNITTDNTIQIKVEKSKVGQIVDIPIHPHVRQIFEKYDYNLPAKISNQKYNDYIKLVVKHAEIEEHITREQRIKGMMVTITTPKHDLITSHTARRSFATNAFLADVPVLAIMKITGHKTETAFMKYIKMSSKDNAMKLQSHKFFNPLTIAR